jgi:hypothetical protein
VKSAVSSRLDSKISLTTTYLLLFKLIPHEIVFFFKKEIICATFPFLVV